MLEKEENALPAYGKGATVWPSQRKMGNRRKRFSDEKEVRGKEGSKREGELFLLNGGG